jgi:AcrR family transcriptional regulator
MARWKPNARERLEQAAMALFRERGYPRTTVGDIAARAGLTERTFFRYFTDKREVLFSGAPLLEKLIVDAVARAPAETAPLEAVAAALEATAPMFEARRSFARKRRLLIAAHAELGERELIKLASLAAAVADSLRRRGVAEPAASLIAETGITIFKSGFERWADDDEQRDLAQHTRAALRDLKQVTAAPPISGARRSQSSRPKRARV